MFFAPLMDPGAWGTGLPGSPVILGAEDTPDRMDRISDSGRQVVGRYGCTLGRSLTATSGSLCKPVCRVLTNASRYLSGETFYKPISGELKSHLSGNRV
jgi:hypothetical protein